MIDSHRSLIRKALALLSPLSLSLTVVCLCVFISDQRAYGGSLSQFEAELADGESNSDSSLLGLALDNSDNEALPDYESWTGDSTEGRSSQRPTVALFKSLLVPGLGQIGNRQYVKAVIVIGAEGLLFSRWLKFRRETSDARAAFEAQTFGDPQRSLLFAEFEEVKNDRNLYAWLTGTSIFLSMFDAFVDAHLRNFPGPDADITFGPLNRTPRMSFGEPAIGATLSFRF